MHFSDSPNRMEYSQIRSNSGQQLYGSRVHNQHSLPHITQPILTRYRNPKPGNPLIIEQTTSFWCKLFNTSSSPQITLCKCERTEDGHCELVMRWINEFYDWKGDPKFSKAYRNYTRRNIEVFICDHELRSRLQKKLQILGVQMGEKYQEMLMRICKNYLKHTIYYGKSQLLTRENDLWIWFAIGIFYHIGAGLTDTKENSCEEEIIFWSLDILMNSFGNLTRSAFQTHIIKIVDLTREYFTKWHGLLVQRYHIDLEPIVYEWTNELMMGYMGIESIGFFIDCLLKKNWQYVYKLMLSYFQKRLEKMESDDFFQSTHDKEVIMRELMNCTEEWPLIFCNANTFCLDRSSPTNSH